MKSVFDISISIVIIIVSLPLFVILALLIFFFLGKPVLFKQARPGKDCKPFIIYKFRTMTNQTDDKGSLLPNNKRMTKFGTFLRQTSLDELPEFFNVLKGDMSLVGPRPLLMEYIPLFNEFQNRRHEIKPGITGWAQVNGRNALTWNEKFKLDVWYVENRSLRLDIKILWLTLINVIKREGVTHENDVAMPRFTGNKPIQIQ